MITIFTKTHRQSCLDSLGLEDAAAYDARIDDYFVYLKKTAQEQGLEVELDEHTDTAYSYSATGSATDDELCGLEHDFMLFFIDDFWKWYN